MEHGGILDVLYMLKDAVLAYTETQAVFESSYLAKTLRSELGDLTFAEAFQRTGRVINIPVAPQRASDFPRLLNYLTAPHVIVWSAAVASCAIPGVFQPVELLAKDDDGNIVPFTSAGLRWTDGSIELDLPMARLSELFNTNLFIVSQVNPHAVLLAVEGPFGRSGWMSHMLRFLKRQSRSFLTSIAELGQSLGFPSVTARGVLPFLTQPYEGDLTVMPPLGIRDFARLLENPTQERIQEAILTAQRATWPHIPWVRMHCLIEATLQACVSRLRQRWRIKAAEAESAAATKAIPPNMSFAHKADRGFDAAGWSETGRGMRRVPSFASARTRSIIASLPSDIQGFDSPEDTRAVAREVSRIEAGVAPDSPAIAAATGIVEDVPPVGQPSVPFDSGTGGTTAPRLAPPRWSRKGSEARLTLLWELKEDAAVASSPP
jgi:predicted acylesterase/phospholipase RssA